MDYHTPRAEVTRFRGPGIVLLCIGTDYFVVWTLGKLMMKFDVEVRSTLL